jgi:Holliday junction resolvasome RuvABC DNA-binding subunit
MVHVTKTPDRHFIIVDASRKAAGFAPNSTAHSEQEVRDALKSFGFADQAVERAIAELRKTGDTILQ